MSEEILATPRRKGGRPPNRPVTDTPEFKAAVSQAVQEALGPLAEKLNLARTSAGSADPAVGDKDMDFVQRLAMTIAELADQGTQRKRVAPEILAARAKARDKMVALILSARAKGIRPNYRVVSETYLNEQRIQPFTNDPVTKAPVPQVIEWTGVPNHSMMPLDETARNIHAAFIESVGGAQEKIRGADDRALWVTPNGLTVKGPSASQKRIVSGLGDPMPDHSHSEPDAAFADDLAVRTANDPRKDKIHVLGTVAPPAEQNYAHTK